MLRLGVIWRSSGGRMMVGDEVQDRFLDLIVGEVVC
jgi:hypothetical protein